LTCVEVVVPLNVSGVWYPVVTEDPIKSGSIGLSVTLNPPVIAEACSSAEPSIELNGERYALPHLVTLKRLGRLKLSVKAAVGLGYGYGMSGAISLAYALGSIAIHGTPLNEAINAAHAAEVVNGTGLGDVASEYVGGGIVYRETPGSPIIARIRTFPVEGTVCSKPIETMPTSRIIVAHDIALQLIEKFLENPTLANFFSVSKEFSTTFGFERYEGLSFRKKGLILSLNNCKDGWIRHEIAKFGAYVR
jgi:pantoate kinase